jgi:HEAT repeat protein/beta-lactamase regulating signal transducer with metallopeptidase domain
MWQGGLIAAAIGVVLRLIPRRSASLRYRVALIGLLAMPIAAGATVVAGARGGFGPEPTLPSGLVAVAADRSQPAPESVVPTTNPIESVDSPGRWREGVQGLLPWLVALWMVGVSLVAARQLLGWRVAHQLRRRGVAPAPVAWNATIERLAERLAVWQRVTLLTSTVARVPAVIGWLRPVVLVPASAIVGLSPYQLELLLAHELAHVRRLDYLVNLLQAAIESVLFYHPAAWWVSARIREERESCCDDLAVATCGDPVGYAKALVAMEELRTDRLPEPALAATGGSLLRRIRRLVASDETEPVHFPRWIAGAVVSAGVVLGFAGVTWAGAATSSPAVSPDSVPVAELADRGSKALETAPSTPSQQPRSMAPDTVLRHPDPNAPLAERYGWAEQQARRFRSSWIGYSVAPLLSRERSLFVGRLGRRGVRSSGFTISGRIVNFGDFGKTNFPGVPVIELVGGRPDDVAILMRVDGRGPGITSIQASSKVLGADFERQPLLWLGSAQDEESVALLVRLRREAAAPEARVDFIGALGVHRTATVPILVSILRGTEPDEIRSAAAEWLGWHPDPAALVALARAARTDRAARVRHEAAESVGEVALPEAADTLIALAKTLADREARREAIEALGDRAEPEVVPALVEIAREDRDRDLRREAVETLGDFEDHRGLSALIDFARSHPDREARREAVESIATAAEPEEAVRLLDRIARDDQDQDIQREAVETLGDVEGGEGAAVLRALVRDHPNPDIRREAVETIASADPDRAFELLTQVIREDENVDVRREAVETLGELDDPRAVAALTEIAEGREDPEVQREAVESLGEIDDPKALAALARIAQAHPNEEARVEAIETYGETAGAEAAARLFRRLIDQDPPERVVHEILETLAELDGKAGLSVLTDIARNHPNRKVRSAAIHRLGEVDDDGARELLEKLLEKP